MGSAIDISTYSTIGAKFYRAIEREEKVAFRDADQGFIALMSNFKMSLAAEVAKDHPEFAPTYQRMLDYFQRTSSDIDTQSFMDLWGSEAMELDRYQNLRSDTNYNILFAVQIAFMVSTPAGREYADAATNIMMQLDQSLKTQPSKELSIPAHAMLCVALWFSNYQNYKASFQAELARQHGDGLDIKNLSLQQETHISCEDLLKRLCGGSEQSVMSGNGETLQELLDELDSMIGLQSVKQEIHKRVREIQVKQAEEAAGVHLNDVSFSLHMVFEGNPGTGKTTVARIVGKIYRTLGILNGDAFIECDRSDLVVGWIGHTAPKVKEKVTEAFGGVLFIDEAYSLFKEDAPQDFGSEAIDALVKCAEDYRDKVAIILAGYTDQMEEMITKANPGLASRFNTKIIFEDYSADELVQIFYHMVRSSGMVVENRAEEAVRQLITLRSSAPKFGNARGVRNILKEVKDARNARIHKRLQRGERLSENDYRTITYEDIVGSQDENIQDALELMSMSPSQSSVTPAASITFDDDEARDQFWHEIFGDN